MALSFALSFAVLLSAVLPVQSSYCASTCAVHVTQPKLFFVANAPNHIPSLSRKPMGDTQVKTFVSVPVCDTCQQCLRRRYQSWTTQIPMQHMQKNCPLDYSWRHMPPGVCYESVRYMRPMVPQGVHGHEHNHVCTKVLHQKTSHGNAAAAACPTSLHHSLILPYRNTLTPFRY